MTADFITALLVNAAVFSALLGIMLLVRALMGKRLSALLRYALWAVVIIKLLIPFGFESHISPIKWLPPTPVHTAADAFSASPSADYEAQPVTFEVANNDEATKPSAVLETNIASPLPQSLPVASAAEPQTTAAPLNWTDWTFMVWAAGAAAACCWLLLCRYQIWRSTSRRSVQPDTRIQDMFEQCKRELGIRRNIRLRMQSAAAVPAITGLIRPMLLIPCNLTSADDETLRHVFLHELTHYKRGDLAVLALLNLLSCVYWFNPLTWLAFKLVRRDMETVCDQRVLQRIEGISRSGYIQTVLQFAGAPANRRLSAALSLNDGRVHMEKRIRNMFRTRRTGIRARIMAICVSLLLLAACVLTACQPAIQNHISIENLAQSTYAADVSKEVKSQANVTVHIDADVEGLGITTLPVYTVEQGKLTQENLDSLADYFLPEDASYYILTSPNMCDMTKQEVQDALTQLQAEVDAVQAMSDVEFESLYYPIPEGMVYYNLQNQFTSLQTQLETAPEEITYERLTGGLHLFYGTSGVFTDLEDGSTACIGGDITVMSYSSNALNQIDPYSHADTEQPDGVKMTQQEAIALTQDTLDALGITGMALTDVSVKNVYRMSHVTQSFNPSRSPADAQCWGLTFNRSVAGIPVIDTLTTTLENISCAPTKDINPSYFAEQIFVAVDDTGVLSFYWNNPTTLTGTVTESAVLLPFDDILDTALDSMYYGIEPIAGFPTTVNIHTIRLRYAMVINSDALPYRLTPVWDFIGDAVRSDGSSTYTLDDNRVFLTVDALDGSVIDLTYE